MSDLRTAAQQALEALGLAKLNGKSGLHPAEIEEIAGAITALKAALAEPVQEPVAWMYSDDHKRMLKTETFCTVYSVKVGSPDKGVTDVPLFTAPPQRKPLTEEEIREMFFAELRALPSYPSAIEELPVRFARAIERAHGIKE